jgi:CO/xanthine dehydrogenase FAD-binding subunit
MHHFDYHKATSLEDAFQKVSASPGARYLGEERIVLVLIKQGAIRPQQVIDIKGITIRGRSRYGGRTLNDTSTG